MNYDYEALLSKGKSQLPEKLMATERFEMPKLTSAVIGNRTKVFGLDAAAKTVRRDMQHILKYLSKELATQANAEGNAMMFTGKFSNAQITKKFEEYVNEFVLCHECKKPDTSLIKNDRIFIMKCEACGARKTVEQIK